MFQLGLKLFSTNIDYIEEAYQLLSEGLFQYVELYTPPNTFKETQDKWKKLKDFPFIIHAPHFRHGVNLADISVKTTNLNNLKDAQCFADTFNAPYIIVHGGNSGTLQNTIEQIASLHDARFLLENLPRTGVNDEICVSTTPEEIQFALDSGAFTGFVLDIGHAIVASQELTNSPYYFLEQFIEKKPAMYHFMDGVINNRKDVHLALGEGEYDFRYIMQKIPQNATITIETPIDFTKGLDDHKTNAQFLRYLEMELVYV